tara:strand:- start:229 stop:525 length:297 start_codon:yes stop_codon:yes gene_type:complete
MMELHFTDREIGYLSNTKMNSCYEEQSWRFDLNDGEMRPTEGGVMLWCGDNFLNAKIVAQHYRSGENPLATSIMWDEGGLNNEWVVWVDAESLDDPRI